MLEMLVGLVANAHWTVVWYGAALKAREVLGLAFGERIFERDPIHRPDVSIGICDDVHDPAVIVFKSAASREARESADNEISVANPARSVIPISASAWSLWNAGCHCGDYSARRLVGAQLEGNCRPDYSLLPFRLKGKPQAPTAPILVCVLLEAPGNLRGAVGKSFVWPEHKAQRAAQVEGSLLQNVVERRIGCQTKCHLGADIANMIGAVRQRGPRLTVVEAGS